MFYTSAAARAEEKRYGPGPATKRTRAVHLGLGSAPWPFRLGGCGRLRHAQTGPSDRAAAAQKNPAKPFRKGARIERQFAVGDAGLVEQ